MRPLDQADVQGSDDRPGASLSLPGGSSRSSTGTLPPAPCPLLPPSTRDPVPVAQKIRGLITDAFKEKQAEADITQVNRLIVKGRMELEEVCALASPQLRVRAAQRASDGARARAGGVDPAPATSHSACLTLSPRLPAPRVLARSMLVAIPTAPTCAIAPRGRR